MARQPRRREGVWPLMALALAGCGDVAAPLVEQPPASIIIGPVSFSAITVVTATGDVVTTVTATNAVTDSAKLEIKGGGCRIRHRVFRTPDRSGPAIWDHDRWSPNCTDPAFRIQLAIFESLEFTKSIPVSAILGDSLPAGRYYFTARLTKANQAFEISSGDAVLER